MTEFTRVHILDLPHDLLSNCLARVSRLYYPTLCLVSKRFRSLITSLELYQTRALLGRTESCLYLCLRLSYGSKQCWYTLCKRPTPSPYPNPNPKPKPNPISGWFSPCFRPYRIPKSSNYHMVSVSTRKFSHWTWWTCAAIGSTIYTVGKYIYGGISSRVFFLDCRSHTWHEAPSIQMTPKYPLMSVIDGKIYVVEGLNVPDSSDSMKVFDLKKQIWEHLPCPRAEIFGKSYILRSLAIDGKLYLFGDKNMVYKVDENKWDVVGLETRISWAFSDFSCVIDNIMYNYILSRKLQWYDSKGILWRDLKGLEELPKMPKSCTRVRMVNHGGKIALLWDKKVRGFDSNEKNIWCAVFAVERRSEQEVYGKLEWCEVVLKVPKSCCLLEFLAVDV